MVAELYRYSDRPERLELFPKELRDYHKTRSKHKRRRQEAAGSSTDANLAPPPPHKTTSIAQMWGGDFDQDDEALSMGNCQIPVFGSLVDDAALLDAAGF